MKWKGVPLLGALVALDAWLLVTVVTAIFRSGGHGAVFWTAVSALCVMFIASLGATFRIGRRVARTYRERQ
jgi:Na+/alanine symporter